MHFFIKLKKIHGNIPYVILYLINQPKKAVNEIISLLFFRNVV